VTDPAKHTLPDLLGDGLDLVFVGINPSLYSVAKGHYFARRSNRFWPCVSRSVLTLPIRAALGVSLLQPVHDRLFPAHGIGFTDVVKRATTKASEVRPRELRAGADALRSKLERDRPRLACFHGMTGFRPFAAVLGWNPPVGLGLQPQRLGPTRLFVVPSPSGANAHCSREQQTAWYDRLAAELAAAEPAR
jgi:TDG/mug DNA glycosylase family protein